MPSARPTTVELRRDVLVGLCLALGLALLAVAFLLGRYTVRPSREVTVASAPLTDPAPLAGVPATAPPQPVATAETTAPETPAERSVVSTAAAVNPNERAAVVRYFAQLDRIEASGKSWADPQQFAMQLVQQSVQGDRRGLDDLLATERQARETLRGLSVPPACREHHAEALALMDEAIGMLGHLGQAMASQDLTALGSVATAAGELETRTKRLEALGASLKRQYGIAAS